MIRDTHPVAVLGQLGSEQAAQWDCLAERLIGISASNVFTGAILRFKDVETAAHSCAAQQGSRLCDSAWIWRELGIETHR